MPQKFEEQAAVAVVKDLVAKVTSVLGGEDPASLSDVLKAEKFELKPEYKKNKAGTTRTLKVMQGNLDALLLAAFKKDVAGVWGGLYNVALYTGSLNARRVVRAGRELFLAGVEV